MTLYAPAQSRALILALVVGQAPAEALVLHLYVNNKTPADGDRAADYDEAPPGYGYAPLVLAPGTWAVSSEAAIHPEVTFTFLGAMGNVYGYYVTQKDGGGLLWAERFGGGPYNIANNGDEIRIVPRLTLGGAP